LLAVFFGILGAHPFYLGHKKIGIIQLYTLGGLGIWFLTDWIRIISGNLIEKDYYLKELCEKLYEMYI
jgi:TM2 domain-containing membrane protein YozV